MTHWNVVDFVYLYTDYYIVTCAGPTVWNSLPNFIRDPTISLDGSDGCLKLICSLDTSAFSALEVLTRTALYKFTYLLTELGQLKKRVNRLLLQ